jgi:hypothetical protein
MHQVGKTCCVTGATHVASRDAACFLSRGASATRAASRITARVLSRGPTRVLAILSWSACGSD